VGAARLFCWVSWKQGKIVHHSDGKLVNGFAIGSTKAGMARPPCVVSLAR